jgi:hypothetical protein
MTDRQLTIAMLATFVVLVVALVVLVATMAGR